MHSEWIKENQRPGWHLDRHLRTGIETSWIGVKTRQLSLVITPGQHAELMTAFDNVQAAIDHRTVVKIHHNIGQAVCLLAIVNPISVS